MSTTPIHPRARTSCRQAAQKGVSLVELMVGMAIGLLVVAVAAGALLASRGVSGTVSDASQLQQQASFAFRVLGQQIRQAGSLRLNLAAAKGASEPIAAEDPVVFTPDPQLYPTLPTQPPAIPIVQGLDAPAAGQYKLSLARQSYDETTFAANNGMADCLGRVNPASDPIIQSQFALVNSGSENELKCRAMRNGAFTVPQPLLRNIADFQVRYLVQSDAITGIPKINYVNAATAGTNWNQVFGVEVCLVLYGEERIDMPAGTSYLGCDGATRVDMTTLAAAERRNRMHKVFRNVYQIRSQGQPG